MSAPASGLQPLTGSGAGQTSRAQRRLVAMGALAMVVMGLVLLYMLLQFDLPFDHYEHYIRRIQELTSTDLLEVQRRIYDRTRWVVGAAGVASEVESAIAPFVAQVRPWNAEGY